MSRTMYAILPAMLLVVLSVLVGPLYAAEPPDLKRPTAQPNVLDLGNQRYRVGLIEVDVAKQHFTVPGVVLRMKPPLEFLAVAKGGYKAYESLLELGVSAYEFNLACILIGLDSKKGKAPRYHFDPEPAEGDPVELWVSWQTDGKTTRVEAADLIHMGEKTLPRGEWVYTGSVLMPDGQYLAYQSGTLIGFVHDPASVIEHRGGFGIGRFGDVRPNRAVLPPVGTRVNLNVTRVNK